MAIVTSEIAMTIVSPMVSSSVSNTSAVAAGSARWTKR
jgi:hypothetical protein